MKLSLGLRRFVDWDLSRPSGAKAGTLSLLIGFAPVVPGVALRASAPLACGALVSLAWFGFVGWRASRLLRAAAVKGDRQFDRKTKFTLPPEYAASESVTAARRRARRR